MLLEREWITTKVLFLLVQAGRGGYVTYQGRSFSMLMTDTFAGPVLVMIWV